MGLFFLLNETFQLHNFILKRRQEAPEYHRRDTTCWHLFDMTMTPLYVNIFDLQHVISGDI